MYNDVCLLGLKTLPRVSRLLVIVVVLVGLSRFGISWQNSSFSNNSPRPNQDLRCSASFVEASMEVVQATVEQLDKNFESGLTRPLEYRKQQLKALYNGVNQNLEAVYDALLCDLGKPKGEAFITEVSVFNEDLLYILANLDKWALARRPADVPALARWALSPKVRYEPLGTALIIAPFNFPLVCGLNPLAGAIAAGCPAILKPSENLPNVSAVFQQILHEYLDTRSYTVINGGPNITSELLKYSFGKIFFTGGEKVGKIVCKAAAETLTPISLELGGKSPVIVTPNANLQVCARRLAWGKTVNSGQTCVAPDYVILTDPKMSGPFIRAFKAELAQMYPCSSTELSNATGYGRMVTTSQTRRAESLLQKTKGQIVAGGRCMVEKRFVEPTLVTSCDPDDALLQQEIFAPILPILTVNDITEIPALVEKVCKTPLAMYTFGSEKDFQYCLDNVRSGTAGHNDVILHFASPQLPIGGIKSSGNAQPSHGYSSFMTFTQQRSLMSVPTNPIIEQVLNARYQPTSAFKIFLFDLFNNTKPWFNSQGQDNLRRRVGKKLKPLLKIILPILAAYYYGRFKGFM